MFLTYIEIAAILFNVQNRLNKMTIRRSFVKSGKNWSSGFREKVIKLLHIFVHLYRYTPEIKKMILPKTFY